SRTDRVSAEEATASAAYMAALAQRAKERAALGIEEAADVGIDTLANAQAEGAANTKARSGISERRTQGHRDAAMKMNEDMRELTRIEGENAQQEIKEYYDAIIAQRQQEAARIAASAMSRRSYGYSGGGYSGGGSGGGVDTYFLNAMNKYVDQV